MAAAKRVLRYLCSTSGMGLVLGGRSPVVLTGHADASWADDQATQRSSQGYTFGLGSGSVSWRATRSSSVLGSSCEAEIYAGAMAAQELRWLTYPSRPFEVITDASDFAIGAVLLQDFGNGLQLIAYESRKLQAAKRNYPIHNKEMLAIIRAFKLWRCYLTGADVTVCTDHKSLQITYKKGANNIADAMTRPTAQSAAVLITH
ncbi:unnamed protein product [Closterium sp. NIES-53]